MQFPARPRPFKQGRNWQQTLDITGGFLWLNGSLPVDALKWGQSLAFGLEPLNGLIAEDSATNYYMPGFTGNEGFGFGPWTLSTTGGGAYISGDTPAQFGLWNSAANGHSVASRSLNTPLQAGQSLTVQLQMNNLDNPGCTNAFELRDANSRWGLNFAATPCLSYRIQRTASLSAPWTDIGKATALFNFCQYIDSNAPATQSFYRAVTP